MIEHQTRQQRIFADAVRNIQGLQKGPHSINDDARKTYGGLCHRLPILVRRNGLCQTLALVEEKARASNSPTSQSVAYQCLRTHIASVIGVEPGDLISTVSTAPLPIYQMHTRAVLSAWVFYKRLAVSVLGIESSDVPEGD